MPSSVFNLQWCSADGSNSRTAEGYSWSTLCEIKVQKNGFQSHEFVYRKMRVEKRESFRGERVSRTFHCAIFGLILDPPKIFPCCCYQACPIFESVRTFCWKRLRKSGHKTMKFCMKLTFWKLSPRDSCKDTGALVLVRAGIECFLLFLKISSVR